MDLIYKMQKELIRRKYSPKTIKSYTYAIKQFLKKCQKEPKKITKKDIKDYLYNLSLTNISESTLNLQLQAIKFTLKNILNKQYVLEIQPARTKNILPTVLTQEEVILLLNAIKNKKHKLMIELLYSAGLRVSEVTKLKVNHLELKNNFGWVRQGKGNKDRMFIIAKKLNKKIKQHIEENNLEPENYLFKGQRKHISVRTIQVIIKKAAKKAKLTKNVHPHTLRHSFATHLIENNYDLQTVQNLLGHESPKTTMIYVHLATPKLLNVKSPLDTLLNP
ncbi:MAG: site-specific tyrosine recombinase/integron integrase [archaeon]